jgi:glucan biosynthesis protein C
MKSERLYFADWLRILVVFSLVPFHAALSYTGLGDAYVYDPAVKDFYMGLTDNPGISSHFLNILVDFLNDFSMHLLFFVSGIGTYFALTYRSYKQYLQERVSKLFLPMVFGILFIIPIQSFFRAKNLFAFKENFLRFYPTFFNGIRGTFPEANFEWAHLWFLMYLFVFSIIALPLFLFLRKQTVQKKLNFRRHPNFSLYYMPLIILILFECLLRPRWPGFQNLYDDWANFTNYLFYMIFGYVFVLIHSLRKEIKLKCFINLILGILCFVIKRIVWETFNIKLGYNTSALFAISLQTIGTYLFVLSFIGLGHKYLNNSSFILKYLQGATFPFYIIHFIPVTILTYYLFDTDINYYIRYLIVIIASYPITIMAYELIVKRVKLIGFFMGIKK